MGAENRKPDMARWASAYRITNEEIMDRQKSDEERKEHHLSYVGLLIEEYKERIKGGIRRSVPRGEIDFYFERDADGIVIEGYVCMDELYIK